MLTGIINGTLLCCEDDNTTWKSIIDMNDAGLNWTTYLLRILYKIIVPSILSVGIFGNILILVVLSGSMFRGTAYVYLSGLALAHIGVLVSWIPICVRLYYGMQNNYPWALYYAHLELVTFNTFATASTFIVTCLMIDRYIFVFFPARIRSGNARDSVRFYILVSFALGLLISAPLAGMRVVYTIQNDTVTLFKLRENTVVTSHRLWITYIWIMEITVRVCPTLLFILLNSFVVKRFLQLNAKKKQIQSVSEKLRAVNVIDISSTRNRGYREEQHLAVVTTVIVLCFILTMIPSILLPVFYQNYETSDTSYQLFRILCAILEISNFSMNIVIYILCSKEFRMELLRMLQGKCSENSVEGVEQPVGEIEDFSRHGTTVRLTPELTRLNSPSSPSKLNTMEEDKDSELSSAADLV